MDLKVSHFFSFGHTTTENKFLQNLGLTLFKQTRAHTFLLAVGTSEVRICLSALIWGLNN